MRLNLILALITGLLFCTLSTIEVPEFLRLKDNTSNDYVVTIYQQNASAEARSESPRSRVRLVATKIIAYHGERVVRVQSFGFSPSVDDFLHSLCVLRT
ncbi:MAG TPA: hypothetical protein VEJ38_10255 [Candidatus Acidoferrales bacterium]|nr:hypothetical protein [Candidatus Acidoferrales bacterium]